MAADQKINLKIGADTSDLEKQFSSLIKKIQGDADKLKVSPGLVKAAPGGAAATDREYIKNKTFIDAQAKQYQAIVKSLKEEYGLLQQIGREREKQNRQEHIANIHKATFIQTQRAQGYGIQGGVRPGMPSGAMPAAPIPPASAGGNRGPTPGSMGAGGITSVGGLAGFLGVPAALIGGMATTIAAGMAGERVRKYFGEASYRARETEASAFQMQGQGGQRLSSFLNGGAAQELTFDPLRTQAARNAEEEMKGRMESSFRIFTRPLQTVFGRARNGYEFGNQLGLGTDAQKREIDAQQQQERATEQAKQFDALKNGPEGALRTAVANKYLENYQRDLDFQRQTGLNTSTFRGGFLPGIQGAGFTSEQGMGMASSILGAGGSTRSAVGNAALGLQAQRNLDLTNAGGVLGKLSGSMGSAETTKEAFVKILAEGTRAGLDGSDFREENRKFVESAAQVISQSGTTSSGGVEQILSQFGRFFGGDRTATGIEAGKNAFDLYRQTSMATTGPRATLRAAGMLTDPTIRSLSRDSREALFNMPIDQLTPDNPAIVAMASQIGKTPQELIDAQNRVTSRSANLFKNSDVAAKRLAATKKRYGRQTAMDVTGPFLPGEQNEMRRALGESNIAQIKEHPELGQDQRLASQYSEGLSREDARMQSAALEDAKKQQLNKDRTGRPEDDTNRVQAEASRLSNELFMSIKTDILGASDAAKVFAMDINALISVMKNGSTTDKANAINKFQTDHPMSRPINQPSSGSPNSGGGSGGQ